MEKNEISIPIDVKVDIADKKNEAGRLKNWTRCVVKIEAVKSIPCFLRIQFFQNDFECLCVPVHVPGVQVRLTNSRTKTHSYGITWKHNRKRCHIFFAFETKFGFETHMKWLKETLQNLDFYRREILETRRKSRDFSTFLNFKETSNVPLKTVQDILGPLPKIPEKRESNNWSRRVSTFSGIYEEILDSEDLRRHSQTSGIYEEMKPPKEMEFLFQNESPPELPVRSRVNTFENETFENIPRSNTNPESIIECKKNKALIQGLHSSLFGKRSKRSESVSEGKVSTQADLIDTPTKSVHRCSPFVNFDHHTYKNVDKNRDNLVFTPKVKQDLFAINEQRNQNSVSSPDLSKINLIHTEPTKESRILSSPSILSVYETSQSSETLTYINDKLQEAAENKHHIVSDYDVNDIFNISDKINETFNLSINSSTVNLVGAKLNVGNTDTISSNHTNRIIDEASGYCSMAPIKNEVFDDFERVNDKLLTESHKNFNHFRKLSDSDKENIDHSVKLNYNIEIDNKLPESVNASKKCVTPNNLHKNEIINNDLMENYYQTPKKSIKNIDDKIPSYYHNSSDFRKSPNVKEKSSSSNNVPAKKVSLNSLKLCYLNESHINNNENFYISPISAQKNVKEVFQNEIKADKSSARIETKRITPLKACKISENVYSVKKLEDESVIKKNNYIYSNNEVISNFSPCQTPEDTISLNHISFGTLLQSIDFKFDDSKNSRIDTRKNNSKIYQGYSEATLSTNSSKYFTIDSVNNSKSPRNNKTKSEKNLTSVKILTPEFGTTKKITSLPRFKKIDFSPLKLKINNVLQRNNSDGYQ